jgi:coproporphyrinogen III oxidase-like Fe-S oxidoreductase
LVEAGAEVAAAGEDLQPADREWEALVLSLRTSTGVPAEVVPEELFDQGLVVPSGGPPRPARAVLTPRGRLLANEVALRLRPMRSASRS